MGRGIKPTAEAIGLHYPMADRAFKTILRGFDFVHPEALPYKDSTRNVWQK
jgi:hypothetical protein